MCPATKRWLKAPLNHGPTCRTADSCCLGSWRQEPPWHQQRHCCNSSRVVHQWRPGRLGYTWLPRSTCTRRAYRQSLGSSESSPESLGAGHKHRASISTFSAHCLCTTVTVLHSEPAGGASPFCASRYLDVPNPYMPVVRKLASSPATACRGLRGMRGIMQQPFCALTERQCSP